MARKMDNPELVNELINNLWNTKYSQAKFEKKYAALSKRDMSIVSDAIGKMDKQSEMKLVYGYDHIY